MLAAALVSLFVVVVGSTPNHGSSVRAGVPSVAAPSAQLVTPDASTAPDDVSAPLELAGLGPDEGLAGPPAGTYRVVDGTAEALSAASAGPGARGPPTA